MTAPDPAWVEAGVKALKDTWAEGADTDEDFAAAVIAAVEPLIRAQVATTLIDALRRQSATRRPPRPRSPLTHPGR